MKISLTKDENQMAIGAFVIWNGARSSGEAPTFFEVCSKAISVTSGSSASLQNGISLTVVHKGKHSVYLPGAADRRMAVCSRPWLEIIAGKESGGTRDEYEEMNAFVVQEGLGSSSPHYFDMQVVALAKP